MLRQTIWVRFLVVDTTDPEKKEPSRLVERCEEYTGEKIILGGLWITIWLLNSFAWLKPDKGPSSVWVYVD